MFKDFSLPIFFLFLVLGLNAQTSIPDTIRLNNPSFEDYPKNSTCPKGWLDCGFEGETPPDVQPGGGFEVNKQAFHGGTYLGLVVRDNDTWEAVAQRMSRPMKRGKCYEFNIYLSRSEIYQSLSKETNLPANYVTPAVFRIWAGNTYCERRELLGETSRVINTRWLEYKFRFEPSDFYTYITFEAYYKTPTLFPYNGNVLVDNASYIVEVPCDQPVEEEEVADNSKQDPVAPPPSKPEPNVKKEDQPKPQILKNLEADKIKEGQVIRIEKLNFKADSYQITDDSHEVLEELYTFMSYNPAVIVELGGHTNTIPPDSYCDKLSTERAKAVAEFLHDKGIPWERLQYKGYGKRQPLTKDTSQEGRKINQRVEVKILSLNG
ncbi:MAG: OmpA family protein [Saprospiraceae bacterium]